MYSLPWPSRPLWKHLTVPAVLCGVVAVGPERFGNQATRTGWIANGRAFGMLRTFAHSKAIVCPMSAGIFFGAVLVLVGVVPVLFGLVTGSMPPFPNRDK